jgi:hypothetical protein
VSKDLNKFGIIKFAHLFIDSVEKVVRELIEALNQLDGAAGDLILEADPAEVPFSPNSTSNTSSCKRPPLHSPSPRLFTNYI